MNKFLFTVLSVSILSSFAFAGENHKKNSRPDDHAPIGVMGDHRHGKGEWMFSYRYSYMDMKGSRSGTNDLTPSEVQNDFTMAPLKMTMQMHMLGAMYGATDDLTIMAMVPYVEKDMDMLGMGGMLSKMDSQGVGDVKLTGLYKLGHWGNNKLHLNAGFALPTGSTDEKGDNGLKLPYAMQLGSGTYDVIVGLTYSGNNDNWSWGGQAGALIRTGENNDDYTLGDEYNVTIWSARKLNDYFSASLRLDGKSWGNIDGADPDLVARANMNMSPLFRTDLRGGERLDLLAGINFLVQDGALKGHRLALEGGAPIYEDLDGPQLKTGYKLMFGWQKAF